MHTPRIAVIGAGVAGLAAATDLARAGFAVSLFERAAVPGGKIREVSVAGRPMDAGPTVFTMRRVFDQLFDDAGDDFSRRLKLIPVDILARHAWSAHERLDLFASVDKSADAIGAFAGRREAQGFLRFAAQTRRIFTTLDIPFIQASRPSPLDLVRRIGVARVADLWNIQPFASLWRSTGRYFQDPRLRQLFARYATYCGSSPFASPATLMLVAHVEQAGVWLIEGGMRQLARQLAALAARSGASLRYCSEVTRIHLRQGRVSEVQTSDGERIAVDAVVCNADNNALAAGLFGSEVRRAVKPTAAAARSLSALTWNLHARTEGFELAHHSVFFSGDYRAEFDDIFRRQRLPASPTVYVCAQDRHDAATWPPQLEERLLCLVNAPPIGDTHLFETAEIKACENRVFETLMNCGLTLHARPEATLATTPADFNRLFPGTGGALYGPASHGWRASFKRAGSRSTIPGLYLAGGSSHPGPGVPMAGISGRLAAVCIMRDYASIVGYRPMVMPGGISMP
jgi:1-hydroxycarotenoid 3,4-desaturase